MSDLISSISKKVEISGIVQGVGFRPFVYQLALRYDLKGFVQNNTLGVYLEVEGEAEKIENFLISLQEELPVLSRIDTLKSSDSTCKDYQEFSITQSENGENKKAFVSPDIALCDDCLAELNEKKDRRFNYELINCTGCGPRYSITKTLPYDRKNTSMSFFKMCEECEQEYKNPLDRRYHAQPVSCFNCGPKIQLYDKQGEVLHVSKDAILVLSTFLKQGKIVAVKGIGGFHLMCDASNKEAVSRLRERKKRPKKPFAVMFSDFHTAQKNVTCNALEAKLLRSKERPIVLLERVKENHIADNVAPDIHRLGVMLPYTPIHHLLFKYFKSAVVATSANRKDEPIYRSFEQIRDNLGDVVDAILDVNRDIINAIDDSVVQVVQGHTQIMRLGRGYAPLSMPLAFKTDKKILALGAEQKSAIALASDDNMILSPHIGDLSSVEAFEYFERTIETFKDFYDFKPDVIVCDKHPDYMSSKWAKEQNIEVIEIQHHYAHVLACMAEHHLDEKVLAFSFDGTGYGDDGTIWGGEVMVCDYQDFERIGHLVPSRLIGGDKAVKEPRRMALSMLFECYGKEIIDECQLPLLSEFTSQEIELLHQAWQKGLNSPHTSSIGRVFDAVASLMGLLHVSIYEAQSGLLIEALCHDENAKTFNYVIDDGMIDMSPMIRQIVSLLSKGEHEEIADRFINTLVAIMDDFVKQYPEYPIIFSGGVFQNKTLLSRALKYFNSQNRRCYVQEKTPINDGAIALGQLAYALHHF